MTAILFTGHALHADRKILGTGVPTRFSDGPKLFVSDDRQLAYAVSGTLPILEEFPVFYTFLKTTYITTVKHQRSGDLIITGKLIPPEIKKLGALHILLMSKTTAIRIRIKEASDDSDSVMTATNVETNVTSLGSGAIYLHGAYLATKRVDAAYQAAAKLDPFTGTTYDSVTMKSLRPLTINPKV